MSYTMDWMEDDEFIQTQKDKFDAALLLYGAGEWSQAETILISIYHTLHRELGIDRMDADLMRIDRERTEAEGAQETVKEKYIDSPEIQNTLAALRNPMAPYAKDNPPRTEGLDIIIKRAQNRHKIKPRSGIFK